jgi:DNA-binding IclR family transcriptional regulator
VSEDKIVPALSRGIEIVDLVCRSPAPIGVSEIARQMAVAKSTTHGLCRTLVHLGLIRETPGGFVPGSRPVRWAEAFVSRLDIAADFRARVDTAPDLMHHTVTLSVLEGDEVVYMACRNSAAPLGIAFRIGMRLPAIFTATGKAIMALHALPPPGSFPPPLTTHSVQSAALLQDQLQETCQRGFSLDMGEVREGMVCIGAAVPTSGDSPKAGIAISITEAEATAERVAMLGQRIADLARALA